MLMHLGYSSSFPVFQSFPPDFFPHQNIKGEGWSTLRCALRYAPVSKENIKYSIRFPFSTGKPSLLTCITLSLTYSSFMTLASDDFTGPSTPIGWTMSLTFVKRSTKALLCSFLMSSNFCTQVRVKTNWLYPIVLVCKRNEEIEFEMK